MFRIAAEVAAIARQCVTRRASRPSWDRERTMGAAEFKVSPSLRAVGSDRQMASGFNLVCRARGLDPNA